MSSESKLTPYQLEALRRFSHQKVAALFMEMGTGKTRTAVELANYHAERYDVVLWLAPVSTLTNAKADVEKWGGFKKPVLYYGYESIASSDRIYEELTTELAGKRAFMICDESLFLKNGDSKRWQRTYHLRNTVGEFCILLNGTPMSRDEMDIYWQMELLSRKIFNMGERQFRSALFTRIKIPGRPEFWKRNGTNIPWMKSRIEPYVYECSLDLPVKLATSERDYRLTAECEVRYLELKSELKDAENDEIILGLLTKMRATAANNPLKNHTLAKEVADRRVVVFCEFREELRQIAEETKNGAFEITGDTPRKERDEIISAWEKGEKPLLIMSGCGAFGLNLQASSEVYFASLPWDYATYTQALHRCFRTGQTEDVNVIHYLSRAGITNLVKDCLFKKISIAEIVRNTDWRKMVGAEK